MAGPVRGRWGLERRRELGQGARRGGGDLGRGRESGLGLEEGAWSRGSGQCSEADPSSPRHSPTGDTARSSRPPPGLTAVDPGTPTRPPAWNLRAALPRRRPARARPASPRAALTVHGYGPARPRPRCCAPYSALAACSARREGRRGSSARTAGRSRSPQRHLPTSRRSGSARPAPGAFELRPGGGGEARSRRGEGRRRRCGEDAESWRRNTSPRAGPIRERPAGESCGHGHPEWGQPPASRAAARLTTRDSGSGTARTAAGAEYTNPARARGPRAGASLIPVLGWASAGLGERAWSRPPPGTYCCVDPKMSRFAPPCHPPPLQPTPRFSSGADHIRSGVSTGNLAGALRRSRSSQPLPPARLGPTTSSERVTEALDRCL